MHRNAACSAIKRNGRRRRRRASAVIGGAGAGFRIPGMVETIAAKPRHMRLHHAKRDGNRHRRIRRIAAGAQYVHPSCGRDRMVARNSPAPAHDQGAAGANAFISHGSAPEIHA